MVQCSGCLELFTSKGYKTHLCLTENLPCAAIYKAELHYSPTPSIFSSKDGSRPTNADHDSDPDEAIHFEGNYFGNDYDEDDFLDPGYLPKDADEEDLTLQDALAIAEAVQGTRWEADPEMVPPSSSLVSEAPNDNREAPMDVNEQHMTDRHPIEDHLRETPTIVLFPGGRASAPIPGDKQSLGGEAAYGVKVGTTDNLWAPFVSCIDWEVAKWAKTRGSGSTVFSDLLSIDGVSLSLSVR